MLPAHRARRRISDAAAAMTALAPKGGFARRTAAARSGLPLGADLPMCWPTAGGGMVARGIGRGLIETLGPAFRAVDGAPNRAPRCDRPPLFSGLDRRDHRAGRLPARLVGAGLGRWRRRPCNDLEERTSGWRVIATVRARRQRAALR